MTTTLKLNSLNFAFGQQSVLNNISLSVKTGQIGCLLGPSGCGKSTLLRLIAGFEQPQSGEIHIVNQMVAGTNLTIPPQNREVGMLFQDLALFPHLTVSQNIAFGLHQLNKTEQKHRVNELLSLCRLEGFQARYPHQLSGGQSQRVALARAMAPKPKLILLDEPFSSVETGLQNDLVHEVKSMLQADQSTALWVTHSLEEAFGIADQMGVMLDGKLLQWSLPNELYDKPAHPDVIHFLKNANLVSGTINSLGEIETHLGNFKLNNDANFKVNEQAQVGLNKRIFHISKNKKPNASVTKVVYQGGQYILSLKLFEGDIIECYVPNSIHIGSNVCVDVDEVTELTGFPIS